MSESPAERGYDIGLAENDGYRVLIIRAGHRGTERIVPPAGEKHAFEVDLWAREVQVCMSPKGRSVRVFVDQREVRRQAQDADSAYGAALRALRDQRPDEFEVLLAAERKRRRLDDA